MPLDCTLKKMVKMVILNFYHRKEMHCFIRKKLNYILDLHKFNNLRVLTLGTKVIDTPHLSSLGILPHLTVISARAPSRWGHTVAAPAQLSQIQECHTGGWTWARGFTSQKRQALQTGWCRFITLERQWERVRQLTTGGAWSAEGHAGGRIRLLPTHAGGGNLPAGEGGRTRGDTWVFGWSAREDGSAVYGDGGPRELGVGGGPTVRQAQTS